MSCNYFKPILVLQFRPSRLRVIKVATIGKLILILQMSYKKKCWPNMEEDTSRLP